MKMFIAMLFMPMMALAQTTTTLAPAADKVKGIVDAIPSDVPGWMIMAIVFAAELAMRFWPTVKPKSFLLLGSQVLSLVGQGFAKISALLDKIIQNLKD